METRGDLRRIGLDFQFENVCDRSEDGFASVVALLAVLFGQTARSPGKGRDPAGLHLISQGCSPIQVTHFSISSSKGKRVKNS